MTNPNNIYEIYVSVGKKVREYLESVWEYHHIKTINLDKNKM